MKIFTQLFDDAIIRAIGWTILHALWQGMAIALFLGLLMLALRKKSSNTRYFAALSALLLTLVCMLITFVSVYAPRAMSGMASEGGGMPIGDNVFSPAAGVGTIAYADSQSWAGLFMDYFDQHLPLIVSIWLLGVMILCLRMLGEMAFIQHLKYYKAKPAALQWQERLESLSRQLGLRKATKLVESLRISTPMVVGFFKPFILVPAGLLSNLSPGEVESVLAHELAHIKRHDYLVNLLQSFVETLLFFHPAVWWISSTVRVERENCCDDLAIGITGDDVTFVKTLASLEEWRLHNPTLAIAFTGGGVLQRIKRILDRERPLQLPFRIFWSTSILLCCFLLVAFNISSGPGIEYAEDNIALVREIPPADKSGTESEEMPRNDFQDTVQEGLRSKTTLNDPLAKRAPVQTEQRKVKKVEKSATLPLTGVRTAVDTLPEEVRKLKIQMAKMQGEREIKLLEMEKKIQEINNAKLKRNQGLQKMQMELQRKNLEMEKQVQKLNNIKMLKQNELEVRKMEVQSHMLEIEAKTQLLRQQVAEASLEENEETARRNIKELEVQARQLERERMKQEQVIGREQLEQQKQMLEVERKMQMLMNERQMAERELQIKLNEQQLQLLEMEQRMQEILHQKLFEDYEFQQLLQQHKQKMQEIMEKYARKQREE